MVAMEANDRTKPWPHLERAQPRSALRDALALSHHSGGCQSRSASAAVRENAFEQSSNLSSRASSSVSILVEYMMSRVRFNRPANWNACPSVPQPSLRFRAIADENKKERGYPVTRSIPTVSMRVGVIGTPERRL